MKDWEQMKAGAEGKRENGKDGERKTVRQRQKRRGEGHSIVGRPWLTVLKREGTMNRDTAPRLGTASISRMFFNRGNIGSIDLQTAGAVASRRTI
jgi:hypothetical protein